MNNPKNTPLYNQRGGVSLFIVMFTAIITTIITISFTQLMIRNQQQATENDLAQRAYDSAMAGVEDAKRVLLAEREECAADPLGQACTDLKDAIDSDACNTIERSGISTGTTTTSESQVGEDDDNQAYVCVKIQPDTDEYKARIASDGGSVLVPLESKDEFNSVKVSWYLPKEDFPEAGAQCPTPAALPHFCLPAGYPLPKKSAWGDTTPPILRAMFIDPSKGTAEMDTKDGARSVYLYPKKAIVLPPSVSTANFEGERRQNISSSVIFNSVDCSILNAGYACSAKLGLERNFRKAYLHLAAIYKGTSVSVSMLNGATPIKFHGVQSAVDSTGRAEHLFRRVKARVDLGPGEIAIPAGAINIQQDLCKAFFVTNNASDYSEESACVPGP